MSAPHKYNESQNTRLEETPRIIWSNLYGQSMTRLDTQSTLSSQTLKVPSVGESTTSLGRLFQLF